MPANKIFLIYESNVESTDSHSCQLKSCLDSGIKNTSFLIKRASILRIMIYCAQAILRIKY